MASMVQSKNMEIAFCNTVREFVEKAHPRMSEFNITALLARMWEEIRDQTPKISMTSLTQQRNMTRQRNMRIGFVNFMRVMRKDFEEESPDESPDFITKQLTDYWNYTASDEDKESWIEHCSDSDSDYDSDSECEETVGPMD